MHRGYVLLWRRVEDAGWIKNHKLWAFWCWCLIRANYKGRKVIIGRQEIDLEPGQFIFGRKAAAEATGLSEQEVRSVTATLVGSRNLTIKSTNKFSIITITNWDTYQHGEEQINQQINQQITNKQPTNNHRQELKNKRINTYSLEFEQFYAAYPKKRDPDRAWKAWQNRNGDRPEISVLLNAVKRQCQSLEWKKENGRFIPYPATWLNAGAWKNEVEVETYDPFRA